MYADNALCHLWSKIGERHPSSSGCAWKGGPYLLAPDWPALCQSNFWKIPRMGGANAVFLSDLHTWKSVKSVTKGEGWWLNLAGRDVTSIFRRNIRIQLHARQKSWLPVWPSHQPSPLVVHHTPLHHALLVLLTLTSTHFPAKYDVNLRSPHSWCYKRSNPFIMSQNCL